MLINGLIVLLEVSLGAFKSRSVLLESHNLLLALQDLLSVHVARRLQPVNVEFVLGVQISDLCQFISHFDKFVSADYDMVPKCFASEVHIGLDSVGLPFHLLRQRLILHLVAVKLFELTIHIEEGVVDEFIDSTSLVS